jgi:type VI secretion system protein VasG
MAKVDLKSLLRKLNGFCTSSLEGAAGLCISRTHYEVTVEHLLYKMLENPAADIQAILRHFEIEPSRFVSSLNRAIEKLKTGNTGKPVFSPMLPGWFSDGWMVTSVELGDTMIRSGSLFIAVLQDRMRYITDADLDEFDSISLEDLKGNFYEIVKGSTEDRPLESAGAAPGAAVGAPSMGADTALGRFCIDFTARAKAGQIDPVFGRDREIRQMIDILGRRRKNNPIVVGEAGVGKTAVVEGFALRIAEGDVPDILKDVTLLVLDLGLLQAGAGMKGEFENRLKNVISEVKASPKPIILFIDEAHTLIGAGAGAGGGDAANLLKPALARGELRTVAATTWSEYKKYFEKDAALARRFQLVKLDEPSVDDTVLMLRGLRKKYEDAHKVSILDDALVSAAQLSKRYISGRLLPDKAVDLIDTCAARVKIAISSKPAEIEDVERSISALERELAACRQDADAGAGMEGDRLGELEAAIKRQNEKLAKLKERWQKEKEAAEKVLAIRTQLFADVLSGGNGGEAAADKAEGEKTEGEKAEGGDAEGGEAAVKKTPDELKAELEAATRAFKDIQGKEGLIPLEVDPEVIGRVVSDWTGIPVNKMVSDEAQAILDFDKKLKERIKGQDFAVESVARGIRASKAGVQDPGKPIGVFLFVGPSGVGKTECALGVADLLFGGERFIATINMSEFQEKHTVSRLIGSPPGYVGYGEGGVLTEAVRQHPYSVVLLDEVEKADPEVMNLFYQVFDKGVLNDGEGRTIDFKNTVIFMTSNLCTDLITEAGQRPEPPTPEELIKSMRPELNKWFKPALVGRMTVVPFYPLLTDAMKEIVELKIGRLAKRLMESHKMKFTYGQDVIDQIAARCVEVETGARNIDNIMQGTLLPRISSEILEQMTRGPLPAALHLGLDDKGEFVYTFSDDVAPAPAEAGGKPAKSAGKKKGKKAKAE